MKTDKRVAGFGQNRTRFYHDHDYHDIDGHNDHDGHDDRDDIDMTALLRILWIFGVL